MKSDDLVEPFRTAGQAYLDRFHGDWKAMAADLNRRSRESGRKTITHQLRKPVQPRVRKAG